MGYFQHAVSFHIDLAFGDGRVSRTSLRGGRRYMAAPILH
jgi:hypothetical protein